MAQASEYKYGYKQATISLNGTSLPFRYRDFSGGERVLLLALHGGGQDESGKSNDESWGHMCQFFNDDMARVGGVVIATRMPKNVWNGHFIDGIDALYAKLISCAVAGLGLNPNRVYLIGYSAGGDAVYRLGPRMADRWAAVGMYAGHPGNVAADNLRNVFFVGRVGEFDDAFSRNDQLLTFKSQLELLQKQDGGGYKHDVFVVPGKNHGNVPTSEGLMKMIAVQRNPYPDLVVWKQQSSSGDDHVLTKQMYWLEIDDPQDGQYIRVFHDKQSFVIEKAINLKKITIKLNNQMADLTQKIIVRFQEKVIFNDFAWSDDDFITRQLETFDPMLTFNARVAIPIPAPLPATLPAPAPTQNPAAAPVPSLVPQPNEGGKCYDVVPTNTGACIDAYKKQDIYRDCVPTPYASADDIKDYPYRSLDGKSLTAAQIQALTSASGQYPRWIPGDKADGKRTMTQGTDEQVSREKGLADAFVAICKKLWDFCEADPVARTDPRWINLKKMWPAVVAISEKGDGRPHATYEWMGDFGAMTIFVDGGSKYSDDVEPTKGGWHSVLAHELAHTSGGPHDNEWRSAWMFLSRVFSTNLKVPVRFTCGECWLYGVCDRAFCPDCTWIAPNDGGESYCGCTHMFGDSVWVQRGNN